jgi:hypothetical protein
MRLCLAAVVLLLSSCTGTDNPLAPYAGERPLLLQQVTISATPDLQWVGGRVAAVGVNRGPVAALDSTLVWLITAPGNDIGSAVTIDETLDADRVQAFGGVPLARLDDDTEYTFWLAEQRALDAGLSAAERDAFSFADTTFTLTYRLTGRFGGGTGFLEDIQIVRNQRLTGDAYTITWSPSDVAVQRLAIRQGSSGGFTDLVWDILATDDTPDGILPPVTIGEPPPGVQVAVPWPDAGFAPTTHTLWMVNEDWGGSFTPRATGYAFFQIFSTNFE